MCGCVCVCVCVCCWLFVFHTNKIVLILDVRLEFKISRVDEIGVCVRSTRWISSILVLGALFFYGYISNVIFNITLWIFSLRWTVLSTELVNIAGNDGEIIRLILSSNILIPESYRLRWMRSSCPIETNTLCIGKWPCTDDYKNRLELSTIHTVNNFSHCVKALCCFVFCVLCSVHKWQTVGKFAWRSDILLLYAE